MIKKRGTKGQFVAPVRPKAGRKPRNVVTYTAHAILLGGGAAIGVTYLAGPVLGALYAVVFAWTLFRSQ